MYTCRECDKEINEATEICPHCGADLTAFTAEGRAARQTPLLKNLVRWISLLGVLIAALGMFFWYLMKHRMP
jgi:predicted amidophosphoribosyltransferase